jgi:tetratricopeptide (TPR) repeat protein
LLFPIWLFVVHCSSAVIKPDISQHRELARRFLLNRRFEEAQRQIELALNLVPNDFQSLFFLGSLHLELGDAREASSIWTSTLSLLPDEKARSRVETTIGLAALIEGETQVACDHLRIALDVDPFNFAASDLLGIAQRLEILKTAPARPSPGDLLRRSELSELLLGE